MPENVIPESKLSHNAKDLMQQPMFRSPIDLFCLQEYLKSLVALDRAGDRDWRSDEYAWMFIDHTKLYMQNNEVNH
jgi:hypothetical protein